MSNELRELNAELQDAMARQRALQSSVVLLAPSLQMWHGTYRLRQGKFDVHVGGESVRSNKLTTPSAKLLRDDFPLDAAGKPWKKRFGEVQSALIDVVESYSIGSPVRGVRLVPAAASPRMLDGIAVVAAKLNECADEFCEQWPSIREAAARDTDPAIWSQISARVPHAAREIRKKFDTCVTPFELAGTDSKTLTRTDIAGLADRLRHDAAKLAERAIEELVAEPREALAEAMTNLKELIMRDGRVTAASFRPAVAAIEKLKLFAFVADDALLSAIADMERQLANAAPKSLTTASSAREGFLTALDTTVTAATDELARAQSIAAFGRGSRVIM